MQLAELARIHAANNQDQARWSELGLNLTQSQAKGVAGTTPDYDERFITHVPDVVLSLI